MFSLYEISARRGHSPDRVPLPPPHYERTSISSTTSFRPNSSQQSAPTYSEFDNVNMASSSGGLYDNKVFKPFFSTLDVTFI